MTWFTEHDLRTAAGDGSFRRGRDYVDCVGELHPTALGVRASVRGKDTYEVWLGRENDKLTGECECPFGLEGNFCKHCVAVGLVVLSSEQAAPAPDLTEYLHSLDKQELVDLLLEQANRDPALCRQLTLRAGTTGAPQVAVLRQELDTALRARGFVDRDYATRAKDILDTIQALVESGHAAEARPLARHAVELLSSTTGAIDDPVGTVAGICRRAVKLYAKACTTARPNPTKLATWLFQLRLSWTTWPTIDIADFTAPLGDTGMAEYRSLVEEAWHSLPDDADPTQLRAMREQLARTTGDADTMVAILSDALPAPKAYRDIVEVLKQAGRTDEAINWAEKGAASAQDVSLTELLVETYLESGRLEEAVAIRKAELYEAKTRLCYARLRETAEAAATWQTLRPWARKVLEAEPKELVGALLDENDVEEAWQTAKAHNYIDAELARRRCETHPADVLPAYRSLVEARLTGAGRDTYREAAILLQELSKASTRCGEQITDFVTSLKTRHARKPALLDELKRAGF